MTMLIQYSYTSIVEYLIKRQVSMSSASGKAQSAHVLLPIADKPLVKGHNFFASGNVGEVKLNCAPDNAVHIRCGVLASMRDVRYDVQCVIDGQTGLIRCAACKCPAGAGGVQSHRSPHVRNAGLCNDYAKPRLLHEHGTSVASAETCDKASHETTRRRTAEGCEARV